MESIAYRAEDREVRKKTKMETTFINFVSYFLDKFENRLNLPVSTITLLRNESIQLYNLATDNNNKLLNLEIIAEKARKTLDIQTNADLLYKLELSGIYVLEKKHGCKY